MPVITNFGDVSTQGNTAMTGNVTIQGTGTSSWTSASSAVTLAGTLAVTGVTTHTGNIVPSGDLVSNIGTQTSRFIGLYTSNANVYTTANILAANVLTLNVYNVVYLGNTTYHIGPSIFTGNTTVTGIIQPSGTGVSGVGAPGALFANAWIQTANIGSAIAQQSMNITGNVFVSNSINVTNVLSVTTNASYLNVLTYANISQLNVFTGANVTYLNVMNIANVNIANVLTTNVQSANIVFANIQNLNVSTGANVSYLNVAYIANVNNANVLTTNVQSANIVFANVQNLNVSTGANVSYLNVAFISNINNANVLTLNVQTSNTQFANIVNLNVSSGANISYLNVFQQANIISSNLVTANVQSANIVFANVQNLNVSTGANVSYLNVAYIANVNNANVLTTNVQSANIVFANVQNLNVSTGANVSYLNVAYIANVNNANVLTTNVQSANIVFANVQNLNVSTGANVSYLNVAFISNINNANVLTLNVQTANIVTANIVNLNVSSGANISYLNVYQQANIITANIITALHSNLNVSSNANVFNANIFTGNVQTTFNVSGLLSGTLHTGNGSALANLNASNVTQGLLNFSATALGGATGIRINGLDGINGQYLTTSGGTTGAGVQWGGPSATIIWTQMTSISPYPIYYNLANVGIGVTGTWATAGSGYNAYPGAPLDVWGGTGAVSFSNVSDAQYTGIIRIQCSSASYTAAGGLEFKTGANSAGTGHRLMTAETTSSSGIAPLIFQYRANSNAWSNAMTIYNSGGAAGYVGIGTTAPLFNLHIYQLSTSAAAIATVQSSGTGQYAQIALANPSSGTTVLYLNGSALAADGPANSATLRNNVGDLRLAAQSTTPYIYLQSANGSVGINTSNPGTYNLNLYGTASGTSTTVGALTNSGGSLNLSTGIGTSNVFIGVNGTYYYGFGSTQFVPVNGTGTVNIGTAANQFGVVYAGQFSNQDNTNGYVQINKGTASLPGYIAFYNASNTRQGYVGYGGITNYLALETENTNIGYNVTGNMIVNGLFGLGTGATPTYKLQVTGVSGNTSVAQFYGVAGSMYMYLDNDNAANQVAIQWNKAGTMQWINYVPGSSTDLRWNNGSDKMILNSSGNLTISSGLNAGGTIQTSYAQGSNNPTAGQAYFYNPTNSAGQNASVNARIAGAAAGSAYYSLDCNGVAGFSWGITGASQNLVYRASWDFSTSTLFTMDRSGNFTAIGNITTSSDQRLKDNIQPIPNALEKINQIGGYTFERIDVDCAQQAGVLAQEILDVLPEGVYMTDNGTYSVSYGSITALLVQALKEEVTKREDLERRLSRFEEFFELAHMGL